MNYDNFEVPFSSVFVAKRRSGKTVLAEYVINKLIDIHRVDKVYIFSKTCQYPNNWASIPIKYKICNLDFELIHKIMEYQREQVMNKKKKNKKIEEVCFIFDDVIELFG